MVQLYNRTRRAQAKKGEELADAGQRQQCRDPRSMPSTPRCQGETEKGKGVAREAVSSQRPAFIDKKRAGDLNDHWPVPAFARCALRSCWFLISVCWFVSASFCQQLTSINQHLGFNYPTVAPDIIDYAGPDGYDNPMTTDSQALACSHA